MKTIARTKDKRAIADDEDYKYLSMLRWRTFVDGNTFYAMTTGPRPDRWSTSMHRIIMGANDGQIIDHMNGNGLDNRKSNLRFCTFSENSYNKKIKKKYRGVCLKRGKRWYSSITCQWKTHHLGVHETERDAAMAYDVAAKKLFGEFARLNFP